MTHPSTPSQRTCGELLVHLLAQYGVDTVFGIPGVHTVELYRGLPQPPSATSPHATSKAPVLWPTATPA